MSEFAFLFRGRDKWTSPQQMQESMKTWLAWLDDLKEGGHIQHPGLPLEFGGNVVRGKGRIVSDGPFAEAKDVVGGLFIVEASDIAQAVELSKGCPVLDTGGSVEVRQIQKRDR